MRLTIPTVLAVLVLAGGVAAAEEIIFFTNGTSMPVRGHEVADDGEMIRVDLGDGDWLAFPRAQVERIEEAGREVFPGSGPSNRILEDGAERDYRVSGRRPGRYNRRAPQAAAGSNDRAVGQDANGIPVYRPFIDSRNPAMRQVAVTGHAAVLNGSGDGDGGAAAGLRRTHQIGGPQRYDKTGGAAAGKPQTIGFERRAGGGGSSGGGSSGGASGGGTPDGGSGGGDD